MLARRPCPAQRAETIANTKITFFNGTASFLLPLRPFSYLVTAVSWAQIQEEIRTHEGQSDLSKSVLKRSEQK